MYEESLTQNTRDDRRDIGRKNAIFKNGIKEIEITGKCYTSKPLTEVKISCPCRLKWELKDAEPSLAAQASCVT